LVPATAQWPGSLGEFGVAADACHLAGGEAADAVSVDAAGVLRQKVVEAGHGGGDGLQLPVGERDGGAAPGVEDHGRFHRAVEGRAEGEDGSGVVGQVAVVGGIEGCPGDEASHGVGDEDEACGAFVDAVAAGVVVGGMLSPGGQMTAGGIGQETAVDGDGQAPVVGELQDGGRVGDAAVDRVDQVGVGLEPLEVGGPGRVAHQLSGLDAAGFSFQFQRGQAQRFETLGARPGLQEP
jgi:hypothetical protein